MASIPKAIKEMAALHGEKVIDAYKFAAHAHKDEKRGSGEPYITHPVAVAKLLFGAGADIDVIIAALLHDTLESNESEQHIVDQIYALFGDQVLYLVQAVSKDCKITDKKVQQDEYMNQIERSFGVDISVFTIKIADLIHNLSTIDGLPIERKKRWIHELHTQYFPVFTGYFHRVPLGQQQLFMNLMDALERELAHFDALHNTFSEE
ncbi:MAG: HD domain-containing protein [Candidatus Peribacteraceae bacterium]